MSSRIPDLHFSPLAQQYDAIFGPGAFRAKLDEELGNLYPMPPACDRCGRYICCCTAGPSTITVVP